MFLLYSNEATVFDFDDYAGLLNETRRIGAKKVLEFGPGFSTLALLEAGCTDITSLENSPIWLNRAKRRLRQYQYVHLGTYQDVPNMSLPGLDDDHQQFDMIFVDSPPGNPDSEGRARFNPVMWSLGRAPVVLLHDAKRQGEQNTLVRLPKEYSVEMIDIRKGLARITPNA